MKRGTFRKKPISEQKLMKRSPLARKSKSIGASIKDHIQETARFIVTYRDGGCILRKIRHPHEGEAKVIDGKIVSDRVIQAEHLVTRANASSYADTRLIVCICKNCHGWKHWNKEAYDKLVKSIISKERVELWDKVEEYRSAHRTSKIDFKMQLVVLQMELKDYENN